MTPLLDHVAVLVTDIHEALAALAPAPGLTGEPQSFPAEGTREIYLGSPEQTGRLLLLEAIGPGPYARALARRGPGLHHLALRVDDVRAYTAALADAGWYLHARSLDLYVETGLAYLCRPQTPTIVEVLPRDDGAPPRDGAVIRDITLPFGHPGLARALDCPAVRDGPKRSAEASGLRVAALNALLG